MDTQGGKKNQLAFESTESPSSSPGDTNPVSFCLSNQWEFLQNIFQKENLKAPQKKKVMTSKENKQVNH